MQFTDEQLLRYSRQIMLPEFDIEGQTRLRKGRALIVGLGGLGCPVSMYLAASGIGELVLVDDDLVDTSNLQRQIGHTETRQGQPKVHSVATALQAINQHVKLHSYQLRVDNHWLCETLLIQQVPQIDVVVDCSDNLPTRWLLNRWCWQYGVPLVSGAAIRFEGQISVFDARKAHSPCYHCLYPETKDIATTPDDGCTTHGVMAPVVGIIGSLQAMEAIKVITATGEPAVGKLLVYDGLQSHWQSFELPKRKNCQVCFKGGKE